MAGRNKWRDLKAKLPPEVREAAARQTAAMLAAMELDELRRARNVTQEELAERLGKHQSGISRMEKSRDMHVSTLREVIEALGGEMVITARFPDADVRIEQFERAPSEAV